MANENESAVIFLERDRLYLSENGKIYTIMFPASSVRDLDVIDPALLSGAIETAVKGESLPPASIIFVLSDAVCFNQDLPEGDSAKKETEAKTFLDSVPFMLVVSRVYSSGNSSRVVAANGELVNTIMETFEKLGFKFESLVPSAIFGQFSGKRVLDVEMAALAIENRFSAGMQSMIGKRDPVVVGPAAAPTASKKSKLPYLIGTFAICLVALVLLLIFRG